MSESAADLVAGLGYPKHTWVCGNEGCPWSSGLYYSAREAEAAWRDHVVIAHDVRRAKGVDDLHPGAVGEWQRTIERLDRDGNEAAPNEYIDTARRIR